MSYKQKQKLADIKKLRAAGLSMAHSNRVVSQRASGMPIGVLACAVLGIVLLGSGGYLLWAKPTADVAMVQAPQGGTTAILGARTAASNLSEEPVVVAAVSADVITGGTETRPLQSGQNSTAIPASSVTTQPVQTVAVAPQPVAPVRDCVNDLQEMASVFQISFAGGGAELGQREFQIINMFGTVAAKCPQAYITVAGHSDSSGDDAINLQLSWQRADRVVDTWQSLGFDAGQVDALGFGSRQPLTQGDASDDVINRRVDFRVTRREIEVDS